MQARRAGPFTGLGAVALVVAAFGVSGETPDIGASAEQIARFYDTHGTRQLWAIWLLALAGGLLVFFAAQLARALRVEPGRTGWLPHVAFAGGALTAAGFWVVGGATFALVDAADERNVDPVALQALHALVNDSFVLPVAGLGILALAAGLAVVRAGPGIAPLPVWFGWVGVVIGAALFVPWIWWIALWFAGLWIVATSLLLALHPSADYYSS